LGLFGSNNDAAQSTSLEDSSLPNEYTDLPHNDQ